MAEENTFTTYCNAEGITANGQPIRITCRPEEKDEVLSFIAKHIRSLELTSTKYIQDVSGKTVYILTRYNIIQHNDEQFGVRMLEIKDPPDGHCGVVILDQRFCGKAFFTQWDNVESASSVLNNYLIGGEASFSQVKTHLSKFPGYKGIVVCGELTPWFFAVGNQGIFDKFAINEELQQDPVYRLGQRFIIYELGGFIKIKTCLGSKVVYERDVYEHRERKYHIIYWSDGSITKEGEFRKSLRPFKENELWIADAIDKFAQLLMGNVTNFTIDFVNGLKFVGKIMPKIERISCAAGSYSLKVTYEDLATGEINTSEGWVHGFEPTVECPDIITYVTARWKKAEKIIKVEILGSQIPGKGKKWSGVFYRFGD